MSSRESWDDWYIGLARYVATRSKDPSTKCGAVIVRPDKTVAAIGYNGFPRGVEDKQELLDNREEKYKRVIHCEMNAILTAREPLNGYTLYVWPLMTCERCCVHVIQSGIARVVAALATEDQMKRWGDSLKLAMDMYNEAGVEVQFLDKA